MVRRGSGLSVLHQIRPRLRLLAARRRWWAPCWGIIFLLGAADAARADEQPSLAMMKPVRELVDFMSALPPGKHASMFASKGLCIVENFAPFLFCGPGAALAWENGFRAHSAEEELSDLAARFDEAHDFSKNGKRVYFSLPTTWSGRSHGRIFEERGAWAFVLEQRAGAWRILGYGWGVIGYQETEK
jgi:hypothetical protein